MTARQGNKQRCSRKAGWARRLALVGFALGAMPAHALELLDVQITPRGQDGARAVLTLSEPMPVRPTSFALQAPPRLSIDLAGVANRLQPAERAPNTGVVTRVNSAEVSGLTRLVFTLTRPVPYDIQMAGNQIIVAINALAGTNTLPPEPVRSVVAPPPLTPLPVAPVQSQPSIPPTIPPAASVQPQALAISSVDFRLGEDGAGHVQLGFNGPGADPSIARKRDDVVVSLNDVVVPAEFSQSYDVRDFGTVVNAFDVQQVGRDALVSIRAKGEYEYDSYQTEKGLIVEFREVETVAEEGVVRYDGEAVTLSVQNLLVRELLSLLAESADVNIIVSDTVAGEITLRLRGVPWDQALDLILTTKGLEKRAVGNVIYVAPIEEIGAYELRQREIALANEELAPLETEVIQVNYAKAVDIADVIKTLIVTENTNRKDNKDRRRRVAVDERSNTLLVYDTRQQLDRIREFVTQLDRPVAQVLIESRIVIANDDFSRDIGVRLGSTFFDADNDGAIAITGSAAGASSLLDDFTTDGFPVEAPALGDRLGVSLPVSNPAGRIGFGILGPEFLIDLELSALQAEGTGQVVSAPRVITADQQEALIEQGVEIPYLNTTGDGGATIVFRKAVLSLAVTPQITPDNRIIMDLEVNKDAVGQEVSSGLSGGRVPTIDTRRVKTQVLVDDGDTVVLGGIYESTQIDSATKVPLLGDIPLLGYLFRSTRKNNSKIELLIFVTPKVVHDELVVGGYGE